MTISWLRYTARHNTGDIKKTEKKVEKNKEDSKKKENSILLPTCFL